jgi:membrane-associated phospholipid phosphatase
VAVSWFSVLTQQVRELGWLPSLMDRVVGITMAALVVTVFAVSRLYLGAHWLPDVAGSNLARFRSGALATAVFIKPERQPKQPTGAAEVVYKAE